ncbi:MAG TPA: LysM domain-containing protein [Pantanalinema sp.]
MVRAADQSGAGRLTGASAAPLRGTSLAKLQPVEPAPEKAAEPTAAKPAEPAKPPASDSRQALPEQVSVKAGESLSVIAARSGIGLEQLKTLNPELFKAGKDAAGKTRAADGRLIYPGDTVRLRAPEQKQVDPAKTTTASNKVVAAAKDYIDQATIQPGGREVATKTLDSATKMLALIPESDASRAAHANKVAQLLSDFDAQYPDDGTERSTAFDEASATFNGALKSFDAAGQVVGQLPEADIRSFQQEALGKARSAFKAAEAAVAAMPEGEPKTLAGQQLAMMQMALEQAAPPSTVAAGGGTAQTIGVLPGTAPAATVPTGGTPTPLGALPGTTPAAYSGTTTATGTPTPLGGLGTQASGTATPLGITAQVQPQAGIPQAPVSSGGGIVPRFAEPVVARYADPVQWDKAQMPANWDTPQSGQVPNSTSGSMSTAGTNGANGTSGTSGPSKKDPNDPKVKQLAEILKNADHKMVRDIVNSNFDLFYASLPEQKGQMIKILLDGRTSSEDQAAIVSIADMARQQGELDGMATALDGYFGGAGKGLNRMLEDLTRSFRDQTLSAMFGEPATGVTLAPSYYTNLVGVLSKEDVEMLGNSMGATVGARWIQRMPDAAKLAMADKLKSWWPFGGNKDMQAAFTASATGR